ncbi:hypothetical protein CEXT_603391 [Caerostris extrusa]|uniref:Uncharacterized protein n=1 Tax=Caerostris extrusa TaxID=172846 RepID=A0AAV4PRG0_CAEEX|nr:hypothetical protein CEXT_603391 [Caerostris extrusa]
MKDIKYFPTYRRLFLLLCTSFPGDTIPEEHRIQMHKPIQHEIFPHLRIREHIIIGQSFSNLQTPSSPFSENQCQEIVCRSTSRRMRECSYEAVPLPVHFLFLAPNPPAPSLPPFNHPPH